MSFRRPIVLLLLPLLWGGFLRAQPVHTYMDLQSHPCMHMSYSWFSQGLQFIDEKKPPKLSWKHLFKNVNYADYLQNNAGLRIIVHGAILPEVLVARKNARGRIMEQINYVNDFIAANSDRFALARSPQEVRDLVHHTDKTIIIHSIEGGKRLLDGPEDARFWAEQGVAFVTLIHLMDDEFGGAATQPEIETRIINFPGAFNQACRKKRGRGLTEKGKNAIQWLADAGIMTDITHMSDEARADALAYMETHGIPPLATHSGFKPIHNNPGGIPESEVLRMYRAGGLLSIPVSGESTIAYRPHEKYRQLLDSLDHHCPGSIDSYKFSYQCVQDFVQGSVAEISLVPGSTFESLSEEEKVDFAIGFESDYNGWINHHRPRYGKDGCFELEEGVEYEAVETDGMPHPGYLDSHWRLLRKEGVDLEPVLRSSEKFLQMWEHVLAHKKMVSN